jgi:hypothetical protein
MAKTQTRIRAYQGMIRKPTLRKALANTIKARRGSWFARPDDPGKIGAGSLGQRDLDFVASPAIPTSHEETDSTKLISSLNDALEYLGHAHA